MIAWRAAMCCCLFNVFCITLGFLDGFKWKVVWFKIILLSAISNIKFQFLSILFLGIIFLDIVFSAYMHSGFPLYCNIRIWPDKIRIWFCIIVFSYNLHTGSIIVGFSSIPAFSLTFRIRVLYKHHLNLKLF